MHTTLNAGSYLTYLRNLIKDINKIADFDLSHQEEKPSQLEKLSTFSMHKIAPDPSHTPASPLAARLSAVLINLICRGLPTHPSLLVERTVLNTIAADIPYEEDHSGGTIAFRPQFDNAKRKTEWLAALFKAHFPFDPRLTPDRYALDSYDSAAEKDFHTIDLPRLVGPSLALLVEPQRPLQTMLPSHIAAPYASQRCDFCLEIGSCKLVFEVDGSQHFTDQRQRTIDQARDRALKSAGWSVFRIPADQIGKGDGASPSSWSGRAELSRLRADFPPLLEAAFSSSLLEDPLGRHALTAVLAPFGVARLQRVILDAIQSGQLSFDAPLWKIVVVERDLRCAALALLDLLQHLEALLALVDRSQPLPTIELLSFFTPEFSASPILPPSDLLLASRLSVIERPISDYRLSYTSGDLVIDHSLLSYRGYAIPETAFYDQHRKPSASVYILRNAYTFDETRRLHAFPPQPYAVQDTKAREALRFFLQNIFRKQDFRDGQLDILARSLALKPVIGLLPTGAGKSICYQLSALLQPGMTIVVDPLISLMIDQVDNLRFDYSIDWIGFINSDQSPEESSATLHRMGNGRLWLVFVSPERFQNQEFRKELVGLSASVPIPYAVIDEAHCVSEWGHDFRTSYLKLASTIKQCCRFSGDMTPVILALSGTASYTVLSDVQREVGVEEDEAKIYPKSFDRQNLIFSSFTVPSDEKFTKLQQILLSLPKHFGIPMEWFFQPDGTESCAGVIFTPHVNGKYGAYQLFQQLAGKLQAPVNYFCGSVPTQTINSKGGGRIKKPIMSEEEFKQHKRDTQRAFKENEFNLLVATMAFGMGIDKPNIRYTIHYNIPHSLEAYYQEAGRAGRDGKTSYCYLIFSDDQPEDANRLLNQGSDTPPPDPGIKPWEEGDVHRRLFLHKNAFIGRRAELENTLDLLHKFITPRLAKLPVGQSAKVRIPFGSEAEKMSREKAIYRLALLGLVQDYTLDFRASQFELDILHRTDQEYIDHLQSYIQRYRVLQLTNFSAEKIIGSELPSTLENCLAYLIDFVYSEIEQKRRAALRTMAEVARRAGGLPEAEKDAFIRGELLAYLEQSPFTEYLARMVQRIDPLDWHAVLNLEDDAHNLLIHTVDGARILYGGCRRQLESYPDHPGLLFLAVIARLLLPNPEMQSIEGDLLRMLRSLAPLSIEEREHIISQILDDFSAALNATRDYQHSYRLLVNSILTVFPTRNYARQFFNESPDHCRRILLNLAVGQLKELNSHLHRPFH